MENFACCNWPHEIAFGQMAIVLTCNRSTPHTHTQKIKEVTFSVSFCMTIFNVLPYSYSFFFGIQLYLYEAVARLMAGANPTETHHLLQRSTLRQRVITSRHHKGHQPEDAGTVVITNDQLLISYCDPHTLSNGQMMRIKKFM